MGQDKKQLTKLLAFVKDIYSDPDNKEFAAGIQSMVMQDMQPNKEDYRIAEIYEYCIQQILKDQAESLYSGFPLTQIKDELVADYIKMEKAHRDNNIDDFGIRLYRQIENIVRTLSRDTKLENVVGRMMDVPYLVSAENNLQVDKRQTMTKNEQFVRTIADFVLIKSGKSTKEERKGRLLSEQFATDMARFIIYYVCFGGMMRTGVMYDEWEKQTSAYSDIYSIRNRVHGGSECSAYEIQRYEAIKANATLSYFRLMSFLVFLVEGVKKGYPISEDLVRFADAQ